MHLSDVEIILGTYEEFLLGYKVEISESGPVLVQTFADHGHKASLRCVTLNQNVLASGGADETIHLYNMEYRRECGMLIHHKDTVNCLEFSPDGSYLITGGNDGVLAVCKTGSWQLEKVWNSAHKGSAIISLSLHPSGKMALTVGADATLRTWNLVKGRQAYATRLGSTKNCGGWQVTCVLWSPSGSSYAIAVGTKVTVYSTSTAGIIYSVTAGKKITCLCFINDEILSAADEEGTIFLHDIMKQRLTYEVPAHNQRVKCLASSTSLSPPVLVSASSSGHIRVWEYEAPSLHSICEANSGCRVTCMTMAMWGLNVKVKKEEDLELEELIASRVDTDTNTKNDAATLLHQNTRREVIIVEEEDDDDDDDDDDDMEISNYKKKKYLKRKKIKRDNMTFNVEYAAEASFQNFKGKKTKKPTKPTKQKHAVDTGSFNGQDNEVKTIASPKKKKLPKAVTGAQSGQTKAAGKHVLDAVNPVKRKKHRTVTECGLTVEPLDAKKIKLGKKRAERKETPSNS